MVKACATKTLCSRVGLIGLRDFVRDYWTVFGVFRREVRTRVVVNANTTIGFYRRTVQLICCGYGDGEGILQREYVKMRWRMERGG